MSIIDPIADLLTRIRNGSMAGFKRVRVPASKQKYIILNILKDEGFIKGYQVEKIGKISHIDVELKYYDGLPVIHTIKRLSKPSLRYYQKVKEIKPVRNNLGVAIMSTSKGIMTSAKAKELNLGGEVLCKVW